MTVARNFSHLPQQDCWQITIGSDKLGEEERCLDEVLCTYQSTSTDMIHDDDDEQVVTRNGGGRTIII